MEEILGIISAVIFSIILFLFVTRYISQIISIKKNSKLFKELIGLNHKYSPLFIKMQNKFKKRYVCNTLQKYRNNCNKTSIINYMCNVVREDEQKWLTIYNKMNKNKSLLKQYLEEYEAIKKMYYGKSYDKVKSGTIFLSEKQYLKLEEKICKRKLLKPITNIEIQITISYTSPAGRNHYSKQYLLKKESIDEIFTRIEDRKESEKSIDYQRYLMTSGKRYDILRRDNFRCQICGRSQSDGAKLEVDHIIPVSKGGKTVDENLQTLCHECNQGKKAKM